jgi:phosphopentomutase
MQVEVYNSGHAAYISGMVSKRVIIVIIDACGVGQLPDAARYGDVGAATIPNIATAHGGLRMPTCQRLGLGNIVAIKGVKPTAQPDGCYAKMAARSAGKDSTSGHWEIGGIILERPFPLFPNGFPSELVTEFETRVGVRTIGNVAASGTEIIQKLGEQHLETGALILYTSADSVFQLAAHESIYPPEQLYQICRSARELLSDEFAVGRVIARPFTGEPGDFRRTVRRRDFSLPPPSATFVDRLSATGRKTLAIGKIHDLFNGRGFTDKVKTTNNDEVMQAILSVVRDDAEHHLAFANLVDFDELWGHRNDVDNFALALETFDLGLAELLPALRESDILFITADHGCDPTIKTSTDHTREYVPLLVYGHGINRGVDLGTRGTFADVACTVADIFGFSHNFPGESFIHEITKGA